MEYFICYKCNCTVEKNICLLKSYFSQFLNMSSNGRHDRSEKFIYTQGTCTKNYYQFRYHSMKHKHDSYPKIVSLYATKSLQQPWTSIIRKNVWNQDNLALAVNETQIILIANVEVHKKVIRETAAKIILNLQRQSNISETIANASIVTCSNLVSLAILNFFLWKNKEWS